MAERTQSLGGVIYGLADPRTGHLRYVGKTSGDPHVRLLAHMNDVRRGRTFIPRHKWIAELLSLGLEPQMFEIERSEDWREAEQFWIGYFRFIGCELLNATAGGDGLCSYRHTDETRRRQSEATTRRYRIDGEREKTSESVKVGQSRPSYLQRMMSAKARLTDESREKMSRAAKIHRNTPKAKEAMRLLMTGRPKSENTRLAISLAKKGKKRSEESIARQRATITGRKRGPYKILKRAES